MMLLMKERTIDGFGQRLTELRKSRGLTQTELGQRVGVSNRVIAYYEVDDAQPPGALLVDLARELQVTIDELLGMKPPKQRATPKAARLRRRLQRVEKLPTADQKAVLKMIDALCESRGVR